MRKKVQVPVNNIRIYFMRVEVRSETSRNTSVQLQNRDARTYCFSHLMHNAPGVKIHKATFPSYLPQIKRDFQDLVETPQLKISEDPSWRKKCKTSSCKCFDRGLQVVL